jgi:hypothetical protein
MVVLCGFPTSIGLISRYSSDESRLGDDADEDELGALVNVQRVDIMIRIPRMSLQIDLNLSKYCLM